MSFHRPITSALEATECLGSLVNSLIGTRNCLKCILEDGETAFIQDINLLLQHLHIEHPVGQYVANACHSFSQRVGTGTKTLLLFTSLLTKAAAGLQYQGMPLSVSLPIMQTCLDACVEHMKEVLIPLSFKFHQLKTVPGREELRHEVTGSKPRGQKKQVLYCTKDRNMDEDMLGFKTSYFKTDNQGVDALKQMCCRYDTKSDCDKCLKMIVDNNFINTERVLDRKSIQNEDKPQFIDNETSYDRTSEFSDFLVNIPTKPKNQEIKGLHTFGSKPEDQDTIHLQMRRIRANESDDDDDISWFFECGGVETVQDSDTEEAFLQNHLLTQLKVDFSISHHDFTEKVEKSGDGIGKENLLEVEKRGNDTVKENVSKMEERGDGMGKENVSNKNIIDETITSGSIDMSSCHNSILNSKVTRCMRNSDIGDLDSEFEQCFEDALSAKRENEHPLKSFDRNKEIDGCSVILEKSVDLCSLQIGKKTDFRDTVIQTNQHVQRCKMQNCIGSEKKSAVFDGHSDKPTYLRTGHTMDDINHKHEDEFDVCFEFDQSTISKEPLVLSASEDKALPKHEDQILPGKISLKGVQTMLEELKVRPKGTTSKIYSEGLSRLQNNSRHFKTMDSSLKTMTEQLHSDKLSLPMKLYLECSKDTNLDTSTTIQDCSKCTNLDTSTMNQEYSKCTHLDKSTINQECSKWTHSDKLTINQECSKWTHLNSNTTVSLEYCDKTEQGKEDSFLPCLGQVHSQLHSQKTIEGTKNVSNSNDFGNSRCKMVSFQRFESHGNNKLGTDFSQLQTSDDIQNIHSSKPKLVLHSRHLNHAYYVGDDKSHQTENRNKAASDICNVSDVNCLQELKNQTNTENIQSGLEGNLSIIFDSKIDKIENDRELKNVESVKQISQKNEKISNARIYSVFQERENNAGRGKYESELSYPAVHSLVSRLGHTDDKDIIETISRAVVYQSTLPADSITSRFDVKKLYCHTIHNSLRQSTDLVDGLLLSLSTDQMILISEIGNKPCRTLMVNGTVSPTFQHIGHKTSMQGPVIAHTIEPMSANQWLQDVHDTLHQLKIDVILSKGPVCEEVILLASELRVVVIENIPFKALQALSVATEKELAVYVDMAAEVNVCQVHSVSPWRSDWMDHGKTEIDSQYVIISVERNILQTVVISQPCQGQADIKEQEFWQCASRVASSLNSGSVIPGGGRTEEHCMKFCQEQSDNIKVVNEEKSLFQSVIWEAMAIVFNEFASTVNKNTLQSACNEKVDIASGSLFDSNASDNQSPDILDDYVSKMAAWKFALEIASNILQLDMYIVTGITGMTKSDQVLL
ncbi:hypothetical protein ACJMK2_006793 [Sinanodonta woodiana]|uniref:Bardet-Biedl syndrome 12 n=1 Tax=Sinanodonta woodiana TaxID=1069815 RepID=A0ABD3VUA5_SINWO